MKSRKQGSLYFSDMHLKAYGGSSMSEDCREEGLQPIARFPNPHSIPSLVHAFPEICHQACPLLSLTSPGTLTLAPCCSSASKATQLSIVLMKRGQVPKHSEALINPSYLATLVPVPQSHSLARSPSPFYFMASCSFTHFPCPVPQQHQSTQALESSEPLPLNFNFPPSNSSLV